MEKREQLRLTAKMRKITNSRQLCRECVRIYTLRTVVRQLRNRVRRGAREGVGARLQRLNREENGIWRCWI